MTCPKPRSYFLLAALYCCLASASQAQELAPPHDAGNGITCAHCHAMQALTGDIMVSGDRQTARCRTCHNYTGMAAGMSDVASHIIHGTDNQTVDCSSCHDPHGPSESTDPHTGTTGWNLKLIRSTIRGIEGAISPAVYQTTPAHYAFHDGNPPFDGICQVCHTRTEKHTNNDDESSHHHRTGRDCLTCHAHKDGFQAPGCRECHDQPQEHRRQIVGPGGDFDQKSKHISGTISDDNCTVCHDIRNHMDGTVVLVNPDTGETWDGSGTFFCLTCHDGSPPPGISFPDAKGTGYDKSAYVSETHHLALSNNSCRHCHEAHGSAFTSLLKAPYSISEDSSPTYGDNTFALCWTCHLESRIIADSDGAEAVNAFNALHAQHVTEEGAACINCHDAHAPYDAAEPGLINFDFLIKNNFDAQWTDGANDSGGAFFANDAEGSCYISCHGADHAPETYTRSHVDTTDCSRCHGGANGADSPFSHDPPPTSCSYCHAEDRSTESWHPKYVDCVICHRSPPPFSWEGASYSHEPTPAVCSDCHENDRPANKPDGQAHVPGGECGLCHSSPGVSWLGATYSHTPSPERCTDCHQQDRPAAEADGTPHATSGECGLCHDDPGGSWLGASFAHSPVPSSCALCHEQDRPAVAHIAAGDCAACHLGGDTPTIPGVEPWLPGIMDHSGVTANCDGCHDPVDLPSAAQYPDHISSGGGDCAGCHSDAGLSWMPDCIKCHDQTQGTRGQIVGIGGAFDLVSSHLNMSVSAITANECALCHNYGADYSAHRQGDVLLDDFAGGSYTGSSAAFCMGCHGGTPPSGVSFPAASGTGYNKSPYSGSTHQQNLTADSCLECHVPHGSSFRSLLQDDYVINDFNAWTQGDGDYALCWNCHSESDIVTGSNTFETLHNKHVRGEDAPCIACHDVHAPYDSGEPGLISFEYPIGGGFSMSFSYEGGTSTNSTAFSVNGGVGSCAIKCHGKDHKPKDYTR